jgi:BirA family biotin operon repressor/biotin-[acetyl-CoA-carboxylase] ligase
MKPAQYFTPFVLRFDSLPSTNTEAARQAASGAAEGLIVVAREQTRGRGRAGRVWASPLDAGLYMSVVLRPQLRAGEWPLLTLAASLAVADALASACDLRVDIKWPNDVLARGRKLCGILAETTETAAGRACVVGIGVNLTRDAYPPELRESATSVGEETASEEAGGGEGRKIEAGTLVEEIAGALNEKYVRLHAEGGAAETVREWSARSSYAEGRRVLVRLEAEEFEGVTRGLEADGALRVELDDGGVRPVHAGDVLAVRGRGAE